MEEYSSLHDLYKKITPALICRCNELNKIGIETYPEIIWDNLKNKWKNSTNLTISDMVNDILNYGGYNGRR